MRKGIARVLTVISQKQREALREAYAGKVCQWRRGTRREAGAGCPLPEAQPPCWIAPSHGLPYIAHALVSLRSSHVAALPPAPQKYVPLDLRARKTRAIRRRLTKAEAGARTEKAAKKARAFPQRKFAVKA